LLSPVCLVGHACFDLGNRARDVVRQIFVAGLSDEDNVFDSDARNFSLVFANLVPVQVAQIEFVEIGRDLSVQQKVAEVATWFDCDDISFFNDTSSSHVCETWLSSPLWRVSQISTDIVGIKADKVTKAMGHKDEANTLLHHLVNVASETAQLDQALKSDALG